MGDIVERDSFQLVDGIIINSGHLISLYPSDYKREDNKVVYRIRMATPAVFIHGRSTFKTEEECWKYIWKICAEIGIPVPVIDTPYHEVPLDKVKPKEADVKAKQLPKVKERKLRMVPKKRGRPKKKK